MFRESFQWPVGLQNTQITNTILQVKYATPCISVYLLRASIHLQYYTLGPMPVGMPPKLIIKHYPDYSHPYLLADGNILHRVQSIVVVTQLSV